MGRSGATAQDRTEDSNSTPFPPREDQSAPDRAAVHEQLDRILAHPLFKNSRRYPGLLRHVVERTLEGRGSELKERMLGVEVLGRHPDYDTNQDPVVRITAGEVRKRLAQYYQESAHGDELRIDLPAGSYVPEFHPAGPGVSEVVAPTVQAAVPGTRRRRKLLPAAVAATAFVLLLSAIAWRYARSPVGVLDRFWAPVLESPKAALLCVGQRETPGGLSASGASDSRRQSGEPVADPAGGSLTLLQYYRTSGDKVAVPDVIAVSNIAGFLQSRGKQSPVRGESSTAFADLSDGPVVFIGAFRNDWPERLTGELRFHEERDGGVSWIEDRRNPSSRAWAVDYATPYSEVTADFAVITRVLGPARARPVVVVSALAGFGMAAAGELLTDSARAGEIDAKCGAGWERKNLQIVVATRVINGASGPPRIVAAFVW